MTARKQRWMIDSLEEGAATIEQEDGRLFQVPRFLLPDGVREGDICALSIEYESGKASAVTTISVDREATRAAMARSAAQIASTPKSNDPGGPIKL